MTASFRTAPASELTLEELTRVWNLAYEGYFVPITLEPAQLEAHLSSGGIVLDRSLVAWDNGDAVGLSLLGVRGERGWIGGFGITPAFRGRGLGYTLFERHMAQIRTSSLVRVQLEVLVQNWARRIYEASGFTTDRKLLMLDGAVPAVNPAGGAAIVEASDPEVLLAHHGYLHTSALPSWNREADWLRQSARAGTLAYFTGPAAAPTGMMILRDAGEVVRLLDVAAESPDTARDLFSVLAGRRVVLVNEPEGSPVHRWLEAAGFHVPHAQFEMGWDSDRGRG